MQSPVKRPGASWLSAQRTVRRSASRDSVVLLATHGQNNCGSSHDEQSGSGRQAGQFGTGARQVGSAVTASVSAAVIVVAFAASVVIAAGAAAIAVFIGNDFEGARQRVFVVGVVGAGDLDVVLAEVGRRIGGARTVDGESSRTVLVCGLLERDALDVLRSGSNLERDLLTFIEALDRDRHALVFLHAVRGCDLLGVDADLTLVRSRSLGFVLFDGDVEFGRLGLLTVDGRRRGVGVGTLGLRAFDGEVSVLVGLDRLRAFFTSLGVRALLRSSLVIRALLFAFLSGLPRHLDFGTGLGLAGDLSLGIDGLVLSLRRIRGLRGLLARLLEVEVRAGLLERMIEVSDPGERLATEVSATGDDADCPIALVDAATGVSGLREGLVCR